MGTPTKQIGRSFEPSDDYSTSDEQYKTWFLGSLMHKIKTPQKEYERLSVLHNRITQEETKFTERLQANMRVSSILSEFFPFKWLVEITAVFRKLDPTKLGIKTHQDRVCSYLGYIELYLTFRGLTLLDSTILEINKSLNVDLSKNDIRNWKMKLLRLIPGIQEQWIKIRAKTHQTAIISTVVQVMNHELVLTDYSKEEIFQIKQTALEIARKFAAIPKARHVKKPEVWARAICAKALYMNITEKSELAFPQLPAKTRKVIENKRWQLDQLINQD